MKKYLFVRILPKLLAKKSPTTIPRSGEEGRRMNCFTIYLGSDDAKPTFLVDGFNKETDVLEVLAPNENGRYAIPENIALDAALTNGFRVYHYYGLYNLVYTNLYDLTFNLLIPYDRAKVKVKIFWNYVSQARFNKKKLITKDSIELLRFMLERQLLTNAGTGWRRADRSGVGLIMLMTELYSVRWIEHPDSSVEQHRLELHLAALVDSGDLAINAQHEYMINGRALRTLEAHEENERRHKDAVRQQWLMLALTLVLAIAATIEACTP